MELRKATREALRLLDEASSSIFRQTFDIRSFNNAMLSADQAIVKAADDLAIDGLDFTIRPSSVGRRSTPEAEQLRALLEGIREATRLISAEAEGRPPRWREIGRQMDTVERHRSGLLMRLMDHMDALRDGDLARR
ncbi:hypothetical protein G5C60_29015 [Streptomyces sp. HC44]|uniref:Uncharacterized protein n=1 Tax=Streptomyces scabichelini TaxID=2711217 RepID=A0A6G4VBL5_9ACTN|nr:hypothetical protein [Streptomyces scabichelini]NGO11528.1 hypothetical protein [Streptomyces scabichelini]